MNVLRSRKNWLACWSWSTTLSLLVPLALFLVRYRSWPLFCAGFLYSMVLLGSHGTVWLHRYATHRAFKFSHPFARFVCRNLVVKLVPEEIYVVSHHVHHRFSDLPGDPYNAQGGWLYCFLADANHQGIAKNLSEREYGQAGRLIDHTGVRINSYAQYKVWGSLCHPGWTIFHFLANWLFWYAAFFALGGHPLAVTLFGFSGVWALGVRTFNYEGHGKGKDRKREGVDFSLRDRSVNQLWPGYVAGEWHNNHHLFPNSARSGFLPHQLDLAWHFIRLSSAIGAVASYNDSKAEFYERHYLPYRARLRAAETTRESGTWPVQQTPPREREPRDQSTNAL
jgi:stearoyl-CoA desaturase (delta-9 desaturase)